MSTRKPIPIIRNLRRAKQTSSTTSATKSQSTKSPGVGPGLKTGSSTKPATRTPGIKKQKRYTRTVRDETKNPREQIPFLYYPEKENPNYQRDLYRKWEFLRSKVSDNFAQTKIEELCGIKRVLWPYQEFLRNFLSKETPYNGALLWHGVGTGKTCGAVSIAEALRPYIEAAKKNVFIIAPQHVEENFKNELYSFTNEKREQSEGLDPGSLQCTGLTYYLPPGSRDKEKARKSAIKARMSEGRSVYKFFGIGTKFPNYVRELKEEYNFTTQDLADWFSNSLFIIDEAHRIVTKEGIGKEQPEDVFSEIMSGVPSAQTKSRKAKSAKRKQRTGAAAGAAATAAAASDSDSGSESDEGPRRRRKKTEEDDIPSPKLLPVLKEIFRVANNTKVVLLTATPIHDDPHEIIEIVNLLRINDKEPELMQADKLFIHDIDDPSVTPADKVDKEYFDRMTKGYISYVRGENPVSFPEVRTPPDSYTPHCLVDITGEKLIVPIPMDINLGLVRCPMDINYQYNVHQNWVHQSEGRRGTIHLGVVGRQITTVVYPNPNPQELPLVGNRSGFFQVFAKNNQAGPVAGSLATASAKAVLAAAAKGRNFGGRSGKGKRVITQFKWQGGLNGLQFLWHENIYPFSTKFYSMLANIGDINRGITFIYSTFVENGAISAAMFLEANGFVRYHHEDSFKRDNKTGRFDENAAPYPLISYQSYNDNGMGGKNKRYRCYRCCKLDNDPIHVNTGLGPDGKLNSNPNHGKKGSTEDEDPQGDLPHKFEQGVYSLYLQKGSTRLREEEGDIIRSTDNKYGKRIKFLIGSKIIGEGVNLFNVRQVHLLDPWHNSTVSYQARGRAIRNCSHKELPPNMRYVMIYEYCASVPEYFEGQEEYSLNVVEEFLDGNAELLNAPVIIDGNNMGITAIPLLTETIDEEIFRRAFGKDVIIKYLERLAKKNAFDCNLFKALNYFPNTDKPFTRQCDYLPCDFECSWEPTGNELDDPNFINYDTYNLFFSKSQVDRAIQTLREIFKQHAGGLQIDDILQLIHSIDPNIDDDYVYQALDEMLGHPPERNPMQLIDRYGRNGKLVYQGSAYIFQPNDIKDELAPIRYRLKPLSIKPRDNRFAVPEKPEEVQKKLKAKIVDYQKIADTKLDQLLLEYEQDPNITDHRPYDIEKVLDTLSSVELSYLFHRLFSPEFDNPDYNLFKGTVIEYLAKRFMLLLSPISGRAGTAAYPTSNVLGFVDQNFQSSLKVGVKNMLGDVYVIVGDRINTPENISVELNNPSVLTFTPADTEKPETKNAINVMQGLATDNDLSDIAYGFYDEKMGKFKVSSTADERITFNTKTDKVSQRSIAKGKVITTYQRPALIKILNSLKEELQQRGRVDLDHIDASGLGAEELALTIEQALRILDFASSEEVIENNIRIDEAVANGQIRPDIASEMMENAKTDRIKYVLYPYQHLEGCRAFGFGTTETGEVKGRHRSQLKQSSAKLNIDKCLPKQ